MIPKRIAVIGIGSLGGYIATSLSHYSFIKELILIDHDIVETTNFKNSIYTRNQLDMPKVYALQGIITNTNTDIKVTAVNKKYIEGSIDLPTCDLVIDCRDFVHDRMDLIDVRLYISSRHLVIDCRQNVSYTNNYEGSYTDVIERADLVSASINFCQLIRNGRILDIIKNKFRHTIDLDGVSHDLDVRVKEQLDNCDVLYDADVIDEETITNLAVVQHPIMLKNKEKPVDIRIGNVRNPTTQLIPKNTIHELSDLAKIFNPIGQNLPAHMPHFVELIEKENKIIVLILSENGGA